MERDWYSVCTAVSILLSAIGLYGLMAFLRKPRPINEEINFDEQSVVIDDESRKSKIYDKSEHFLTHLFDDALTLEQIFLRGSKESVDGNCLGAIDKKTNAIEWQTYAQVLDRIKNFGNGLIHIGFKPQSNSNRFLGIYATNCVEYVIAEYGCYYHSIVIIPLYDTLGPNACRYIIDKAEISCVVCDKEDRFQALLSQANNMSSLKHIIIIDDIPQSYKSKALSYGIKGIKVFVISYLNSISELFCIQVLTIKEVERLGQQNPTQSLPPKPEDLAVICFTSGTTDIPKGVVLTHKNIIANICAVLYQFGGQAPNKYDTMLSFLPLAHMFERCCQAAVYMVGGKMVFFRGDIKNLSEDMKASKPTIIAVVPRLLTRIYDKCYSNVKGNKLKEWLLRKALESKQSEVVKHIIRKNSIWDKIVFKSIREGMGGKIRLIVCGSAPLSPNVLEFMRCAMGCVIVEGYGQTECVCPCTLTLPGEHETGHVGPPLPCCAIKLVELPEMKYFSKEGKGEICVKGPIVFKNYFKDPEKTSAVIDSEGWLRTGDIGQWTANGCLRIIDRKKHIFKLAQGEYIAPEKIENIYSKSQFIAQIFVYGESLKSCLIAVVVPEVNVLTLWCRQNNIRGTLRDFCQNKEVKKAIMNDLISLGKRDGLHPFEQLRDIYLHHEAFSIDNGLLTPTLKTKRMEIRNFFNQQLEDMYRSLD